MAEYLGHTHNIDTIIRSYVCIDKILSHMYYYITISVWTMTVLWYYYTFLFDTTWCQSLIFLFCCAMNNLLVIINLKQLFKCTATLLAGNGNVPKNSKFRLSMFIFDFFNISNDYIQILLGPDSLEFNKWHESRKDCGINYTGSSNAMEMEAAWKTFNCL